MISNACILSWNCYSGLQGYVEYEVAIAAQTAVGTGPYYNVTNFTTPEDGKRLLLAAPFTSITLSPNLGAYCTHHHIATHTLHLIFYCHTVCPFSAWCTW